MSLQLQEAAGKPDPDNIEHVPRINFNNCFKGDRITGDFTYLLGCMQHLQLERPGSHWKLQRKIAFIMENAQLEVPDHLLPRLSRAIDEGEILNL